jgi:mRNA interferase MazF
MSVEPPRDGVWFADRPGDKRRPLIILTRDSVMPRLTTDPVAPVTTRMREIPTEVPLRDAEGLPRPCVANFDNIMPSPKQRLVEKIGRLGKDELGPYRCRLGQAEATQYPWQVLPAYRSPCPRSR